jgi:hypothetical protein
MLVPNKPLRDWLSKATPAQARQLALLAGTSVLQLRHLATGRRAASADLAQRIAHASESVDRHDEHGNALPYLPQTELCAACGRCPLASKAAEADYE